MKRILLLTTFWLLSAIAFAESSEPTKWSFTLSSNEIHVGDTIEIIATATIIPDWYLYSNDFDPTLGPSVTEFVFNANKGYKLVGKLKPIKPKKKFDPIWEGDVTYFVGHGEFRQKIVIVNDSPKISFTVNYQTCSDVIGRCIPGEEDFEFKGLTILPARKVVKTSSIETPNTTTNTSDPKTLVNTKKYSEPNLADLEAEKDKLIQRDAKGNDVSVDYLKSFVKKYSK